jgi:hypothetical protein
MLFGDAAGIGGIEFRIQCIGGRGGTSSRGYGLPKLTFVDRSAAAGVDLVEKILHEEIRNIAAISDSTETCHAHLLGVGDATGQ